VGWIESLRKLDLTSKKIMWIGILPTGAEEFELFEN
jgi:hypothetical protein